MSENSRSNQKTTESPPLIHSTRGENIQDIPGDPLKPRLGRRESEPHSEEITYLYKVLHLNFPESRTMWDLHHYFMVETEELDIQFDISFFKDLKIPYSLASYRASKFNNRVPTMAINILSKSTWQMDVGIHVDYCRLLKIPLYIVFSSHNIIKAIYKPPFLRAYILKPNGDYHIQDLKQITMREGDATLNREALIDVSEIIPFKIGIMELAIRHEGDSLRYRLILMTKKYDLYQTLAQKEKTRADQEKTRADQEKTRADQLKKELEQVQRKI